MPLNELNYFACANSGTGFINNYNNCFKNLEHIYIIKGGSGTGKSYFMKRAAKKALSLGMNVEYYWCSSDPNSLDGLIINNISVGILDGTAPHTMDPIYPGAYDEIINMGDFWNTQVLKQHKKEIFSLNAEKSSLFALIYEHLAVAHQAEMTRRNILIKCVDYPKLCAAAQRIALNLLSNNKNEIRSNFSQGITMDGLIKYDNYSKHANFIYNLEDKFEISYLFYTNLNEKLTNSRMLGMSALCPTDINTIYTTDSKILFDTNNMQANKTINMQRFISKETYKLEKGLIDKLKICKDNMLNNVSVIFNKIKKTHFELEDIYCSAMDFEAKEEHENIILDKMFS